MLMCMLKTHRFSLNSGNDPPTRATPLTGPHPSVGHTLNIRFIIHNYTESLIKYL